MSAITHTTTHRAETWEPSRGGVGMVGSDEVTRVVWNDPHQTELTITGTRSATVKHAGKTYPLKWICASRHQVLVDYWVPRIQRRLESTRLADRLGGGIAKEEISDRIAAWNAELAKRRSA